VTADKGLAALAALLVVTSLSVAGGVEQQGGLGAAFTSPPNDPITLKTEDGQSIQQPVGDSVTAALTVVTELPKEVKVGERLPFAVTVFGDPFKSVARARIELDVKVRRAGVLAAAKDVRLEGATVEGQPQVRCAGGDSTTTTTCTLGIAANGEAKITGWIGTSPAGADGELVFSARGLIGQTERASHQSVAALVARRKLTDVGLTIAIKPDSDIAASGIWFGHVIDVTNGSTTDATNVVIQVRQRIGINDKGTLRPFPQGTLIRRAGSSATSGPCPPAGTAMTFRCTVKGIPAGATITIPVEMEITGDLPAGRWGRVETQARVTSDESDPDPRNNIGKTSTTVVSALPEFRFVFETQDEAGNRQIVVRNRVRTGELFVLAARFMDAQLEPERMIATVTGGDGARQDIELHQPADRSDRIYRSGALILVPLKDTRQWPNRTPVRAAVGSVVKVTYRAAEAVANVVAR
jgi:hypothetical protein